MRDPRSRSAQTSCRVFSTSSIASHSCAARRAPPASAPAQSTPWRGRVGDELLGTIDVAHEVARTPRECRQIGEPQRHELQSARSSAAVSVRRLARRMRSVHSVSTRFAPCARIQLELGGLAALELGSERLAARPNRLEQALPRPRSAHLARERGTRVALGAARSAAPCPEASSRARRRRRAPSRAHASAAAARRRSPRARAATSSAAGASKRTSWQRERIVGSTSRGDR